MRNSTLPSQLVSFTKPIQSSWVPHLLLLWPRWSETSQIDGLELAAAPKHHRSPRIHRPIEPFAFVVSHAISRAGRRLHVAFFSTGYAEGSYARSRRGKRRHRGPAATATNEPQASVSTALGNTERVTGVTHSRPIAKERFPA